MFSVSCDCVRIAYRFIAIVLVIDGNASNPVCLFANVTNVAGLQAFARSQ